MIMELLSSITFFTSTLIRTFLTQNIMWPTFLFTLGILLSLPFKREKCNFILSLFSLISCILIIYLSLRVLLTGKILYFEYVIYRGSIYSRIFPFSKVSLIMDQLSAYFTLILGIVGFASSLYSFHYMTRFYGRLSLRLFSFLYLMFLMSMYLVLISNDVLLFIVFWELTTVSSMLLVAYERESEVARRASIKYFVLANAGAICIIMGLGILVLLTNATSFTEIGQKIGIISENKLLYYTVAMLLTIGFSVKAAQVPLHSWLPDAHPEAPCNVSALLSGVMIKLAIYGLYRIIFTVLQPDIYWGLALAVLGMTTLTFGTMMALIQTDSKKLLAYHSVGQMGYIVLALGTGVHLLAQSSIEARTLGCIALIASLYHTLNHAIFKGLLFLTAGSVLYRTNSRNLNLLGGLARAMPITFITALIASLSISGIPPFNGFVSKWTIYVSTLSTLHPLLTLGAVLAIFISAVTTASFVKYITSIFLSQPRIEVKDVSESPWSMGASMIMLSLLCILLGVYPLAPLSIISSVVGYVSYINPECIMSSIILYPSIVLLKPGVGITTSMSITITALLLLILTLTTLLAFSFIYKPMRITATWFCGVLARNVKYTAKSYYTEFEQSYRLMYSLRKVLYEKIVNPLMRAYPTVTRRYDKIQWEYAFSFILALYALSIILMLLFIRVMLGW